MKHRILTSLLAGTLLVLQPAAPAQAFFGLGGGSGIVYDPQNHAENILTAARSLTQITNQVQQLANEAQMLINQARDLTELPLSMANELQSSLRAVDQLIQTAEGLAYDLSSISAEYERLYPEEYSSAITTSEILADAQTQWEQARAGYRDALQMQASVVEELRADSAVLDRLVGESQGAVGQLQALQAGNQLTALAAKQSMQLQSLIAAQARAEALDRAQGLAAREQGRARLERFLGDGDAYTP